MNSRNIILPALLAAALILSIKTFAGLPQQAKYTPLKRDNGSSTITGLQSQNGGYKNFVFSRGAIIRTDTTKKIISLIFSGHEFVDGFDTVLKTLDKYSIKGAFFLTGDFYRNPEFKGLIKTLIKKGHYLGAHSNKHLLYASWENRDSTLVTKKEFSDDLLANYAEMAKFGITKDSAKYYLPPYEWHNDTIAVWARQLGIQLINLTPGTSANQDWTVPVPGAKYYSSDTLYARVLNFEKNSPGGMNGFILLTHPGTDPRRTDKFYNRLDSLIGKLIARGYSFKRLDRAIESK